MDINSIGNKTNEFSLVKRYEGKTPVDLCRFVSGFSVIDIGGEYNKIIGKSREKAFNNPSVFSPSKLRAIYIPLFVKSRKLRIYRFSAFVIPNHTCST